MTDLATAVLMALTAAIALLAWRSRNRLAAPEAPEVPADGRLRFVLFRPAGRVFTIDAVVDGEGSGRLGETGSTITLRVHRPLSPAEDVDIEHVLQQWADEDRLVEVTLGPDATITTLQAAGSRMRLRLVA